jgi:hypothetical protein
MKFIKGISLLFLIVFLSGCGNSREQEFYTYRQSPEFIKEFINGLHHGKFLIAERGERWESGCVSKEGDKIFQFISASIDSTQYRLNFWGGGIAGQYKQVIIVNFKDSNVISYAFGNRPDSFTVVGVNE